MRVSAPLLRSAGLALFAQLAADESGRESGTESGRESGTESGREALARSGFARALKSAAAHGCDARDWEHILSTVEGMLGCATGLRALGSAQAARWLAEASARCDGGELRLRARDAARLRGLSTQLPAMLALLSAKPVR
ncbi:hypothetical protein T492DRAFT_845023 [Pavlovales sp. CCMP2436]|nr:hypothetical protein T492DRAFT_845023 [Pavlovales sp. CCMP2436]